MQLFALLVQSDAIVVPCGATVYAQLVSAKNIKSWHTLNTINLHDHGQIIPPSDIVSCPGLSSVHDMQISQLPCEQMTLLSPPIPVFRY